MKTKHTTSIPRPDLGGFLIAIILASQVTTGWAANLRWTTPSLTRSFLSI